MWPRFKENVKIRVQNAKLRKSSPQRGDSAVLIFNFLFLNFFGIRSFLEMYAVIEQGSKQYKVAEGDCLNIELTDVTPDAETIELDKVLLVSDGQEVKVGTPFIEGAKVIASFKTTAGQAVVKGQKLYPMHFRKRKNSKKRIGHRQKYLQVVIDKIEA
jgi:large subunit ribosomal protein L21